jgi:hypothetical protein
MKRKGQRYYQRVSGIRRWRPRRQAVRCVSAEGDWAALENLPPDLFREAPAGRFGIRSLSDLTLVAPVFWASIPLSGAAGALVELGDMRHD